MPLYSSRRTGAVHCFPPGYRSAGILSGHQKAVRSADSSDPVLMHKPRWHCPDIPGSESDPHPPSSHKTCRCLSDPSMVRKGSAPSAGSVSAPSASEQRTAAGRITCHNDISGTVSQIHQIIPYCHGILCGRRIRVFRCQTIIETQDVHGCAA